MRLIKISSPALMGLMAMTCANWEWVSLVRFLLLSPKRFHLRLLFRR